MADYRIRLGYAVAPLVPSGFMACVLLAEGNTYDLAWILWVGGTAVVSYASFLLVGLPTVNWLRRSRSLNIATLPAAGAIGGALVLLGLFGLLKLTLGMNTSSPGFVAAAGAGFGLSVAIAFAAITGIAAVGPAK